MQIKMVRLMDSYAKRVDEIDSHRLQDVRHSALRLVAEIDKILKKRGDRVPAPGDLGTVATGQDSERCFEGGCSTSRCRPERKRIGNSERGGNQRAREFGR